jgi:hypothetical protein
LELAGGGDGVDLALLDGGDGGRAEADADKRRVVRFQTGLHQQKLRDELRRRARCADADLHALQIGRCLVGAILSHHHIDGGIAAKLDNCADILTLGLHPDRVFIGTRHNIHRAADKRLKGFRTTREVVDLHIKALFLEVAKLLGD